MTYKSLIDAARIIDKAQSACYLAEGNSPAWQMLMSAHRLTMAQAKTALRGE